MYTEIRFPEIGVRFIAVNDGVDSEREDNDFTPFRNIINEWYAKDTSVRTDTRSIPQQGNVWPAHFHANSPYGYLRNEDGSLRVDEETAPNVRLIFFHSGAEGRRAPVKSPVCSRNKRYLRRGRSNFSAPDEQDGIVQTIPADGLLIPLRAFWSRIVI